MMKSRFCARFVSGLAITGLAITLSPFVVLAESASEAAIAPDSPVKTENSTASTDSTGSTDSTDNRRVYTLNGATITWDLEKQKMQPPNEEQTARLAQAFAEWMDAKMTAGGKVPAPATEVKVETLGNGMKRAQLPFDLMNAALVRVDAEGHLETDCQEAQQVHGLREASAAVTAEEK